MKDFTHRIKIIEDILNDGRSVCMIAVKTGEGYEWNGEKYPDPQSLDDAVRETCGEHCLKPLVILDRGDGQKKVQTVPMGSMQ